MDKILIILGSASDLGVTEDGLLQLKKLGISFDLRIASAHRSPAFLDEIVTEFVREGGKAFICVAGKAAHLAGVVASLTSKPVIGVPIYQDEAAGFDALLAMVQMPKGRPVATMGFGKAGFTNACIFAAQMLGLTDATLAKTLEADVKSMDQQVRQADATHRLSFRAAGYSQ